MAYFENSLSKIQIILTFFFFILLGGFLAPETRAQQSLPRLEQNHLTYLGAFRLPRGENGDPNGFSYGGAGITYNSANDSLFVTTSGGGIAEVTTPNPVSSSNLESLPFASIIQRINPNPTEGGQSVLPESSLLGIHVYEGRLYGTASIYYDANNTARVSHFSRPLNLSSTGATPFKALWQADKSGFVGGWIATIPPEWQSLLGGRLISGNCCLSIIWRTSHGPAAFSWDPADFNRDLIPATPLLYYPSEHQNLGLWTSTNSTYGAATVIGGAVIPRGTRSILFFGLNGTGAFCYGVGGVNGDCYDPLAPDKGQHAYPYNYQVWAYDLNDLADVKAGTKRPWDIYPYSVWRLNFPNNLMNIRGIGGVAYDSVNQLVYISQQRVDIDGYAHRAIIHVFKVNAATVPGVTTYSTPYATPYQTPYVTPASIATSEVAMVPPLQQLVDSNGDVWTLYGNATLRNGDHTNRGFGSKLLLHEGTIYTLGDDVYWWRWSGSSWERFSATQPGSSVAQTYSTPYVTPYVTPYSTPVIFQESRGGEIGGDEPAENSPILSYATPSSSLRGGDSSNTNGLPLSEETRKSLIIQIMTQLINLLTQLIIQIRLQAANVLSAISSWVIIK